MSDIISDAIADAAELGHPVFRVEPLMDSSRERLEIVEHANGNYVRKWKRDRAGRWKPCTGWKWEKADAE